MVERQKEGTSIQVCNLEKKKKLPMNGNEELYFSLTFNKIKTHTKYKQTDDSRIIY